jgi:hypothetical protein
MLARRLVFASVLTIPLLACSSFAGAAPEARETLETPGALEYESPSSSGSARADWDAFADRIKAAGALLDGDDIPDNGIDRAEGIRYLLGMLEEGIAVALHKSDLEDPQFRYHITKYKAEAMPSADARYQRVDIDGEGVYRLSGKLGNAAHITLQAYSGASARETFDLTEVTDEEGRFSIVIGGAPRESNWMKISPDAAMIQIREYMSDWQGAEFTRVEIERLDRPARISTATEDKMARTLQQATIALDQRASFWKQRLGAIRKAHDNSLSAAHTMGDVGLGGLLYGEGWFDLEEDEALIIELDPPEAVHWSFQLGNYWGEWLDWANFTSSTNGHQARPNSDGRVRLVIARSDPGVPNWLDPAGHREGVILYRYHKAKSNPLPTTRLVKLSKLAEALPSDTPRVSPEERATEVARRLAHKRLRWQP